jgi:hypothetical protein
MSLLDALPSPKRLQGSHTPTLSPLRTPPAPDFKGFRTFRGFAPGTRERG